MRRQEGSGNRIVVGWYDFFARFYDASLEALYAEAREASADALQLGDTSRLLDLPVGTGQSLGPILRRMPASGRVLGVDLSDGMLARARERVQKEGFAERVALEPCDVMSISPALVDRALGAPEVDRLHIFLGLTAFPDPGAAFARAWELLRPGGRAVVVDVHAEKLGLQGRMVNMVARADITRRAWEPLEAVAQAFERTALPANDKYGGTLWLATGIKAPA